MMKYKLSRLTAVCLGVLMVPFIPAPAQALESPFGDYTADGNVNAQDAAILLQFLAAEGAGTAVSGFNDYLRTFGVTIPEDIVPTGVFTGDANMDAELDASDAAMLLSYAAALGTGYTEDLMIYAAANRDIPTPLGTPILEANFNDLETKDIRLKQPQIYTDGRYDFTWSTAIYENFDDADTICLRIENIDPNPLGVYETIALTVEEVWIDDVKVEHLTGEPQYASKTDSGYELTDITTIQFPLRTAVFDDLNQEITERVRIVFTLEGLTVPDTE